VVRITSDPHVAFEGVFDRERVLGEHFAGQAEHRQVVAEADSLYRIGEFGLNISLSVEFVEESLGVLVAAVFDAGLQFLAVQLLYEIQCRLGRDRSERSVNCFPSRLDGRSDGSRKRLAVGLSELLFALGTGLDVAATLLYERRRRLRERRFEVFHR